MIPPSALLVFDLLIERLRGGGFSIGIDHYLKLSEVLDRTQEKVNSAQLKLLLCPIFAVDRIQQETFYRVFDELSPLLDAVAESPQSEPDQQTSNKTHLKWWITGATTIVVLLVVGFLLMRSRRLIPGDESASVSTPQNLTTPAPLLPDTKDQTPPPEPPQIRYDADDWFRMLGEFGCLVVPWFVLYAHYRNRSRRRQTVVDRSNIDCPPTYWPIMLPTSGAYLFHSAIKDVARDLKRRPTDPGFSIDVNRTIRATVEAHGFPSLRYKDVRRQPLYVALIRRECRRDHQASFASCLVDALRTADLQITVYYYEDDPRFLSRDDIQESIYLGDLTRRHPGARLLVFGLAHDILDRLTDHVVRWITAFEGFADRAFLIGLEPTELQREEIEKTGFVLVPANLLGLETISRRFGQNGMEEERRSSVGAPYELPVRPDLELLETEIGSKSFQCVCACAVYPELNWNLTLQFARSLLNREDIGLDDMLFRIVSLRWFRQGEIPETVRGELISRLESGNRDVVKQIVVQALKSNPPPEGTNARSGWEEQLRIYYHSRPRWSLKQIIGSHPLQPTSSLPKDYTFLRFLDRGSGSGFGFSLPVDVRDFVYKQGVSAAGLSNKFLFAITALVTVSLMALLWFVPRATGPNVQLDVRVTDEHGQPLAKAKVQVAVSNQDKKSPARLEAYTNALGEATIEFTQKPKSVRIRASAAKYVYSDTDFNRYGQSVVIELHPAVYGSVDISSTPADASVMIDNSPQTTGTPTKVPLLVGRHNVVVSKEGYRSSSKWVTVNPNADITLPVFELEPISTEREPLSGDMSEGRGDLLLMASVGSGSLLLALLFAMRLIKLDAGTVEARLISSAIREGAGAFILRQYTVIAALVVVLGAALFVGYKFSDFTAPLAVKMVVSFLVGAFCSGLTGFSGVFVSTRANSRTASSVRSGVGRAMMVALCGGAVNSLVVFSVCVLGIGGLFYLFGGIDDPQHVPYQLVGFVFGASVVALFAQLGGGTYKAAADVGADLAGQVEAGIREDDPRNPAVIADLIGDNVGDCAGRNVDIFESGVAETVGAMILGSALYPVFGIKGILFPLIVQAINPIASLIGVMTVGREDVNTMNALTRGYYVTSILTLIGFSVAVYYMLQGRWWLLSCGILGMATSFLFVRITEYYTEIRYRPVQSIADASLTGAATNIIGGLALGMETPAMPVIVISAALLLSYYFGVLGLADVMISDYAKGIYGTAIATMGMLSSAAYILAMDTYGSITDNARGIIEVSGQTQAVRDKTDKLKAAGNSTKALTKGYAIGSAALAGFLLFAAYLETVHGIVAQRFSDAGQVLAPNWSFTNINLASVPVFVGALLGAMLIFLFSSFAIKAVGNAAQNIIVDAREQFRKNPGIMVGTSKPDYGRSVRIVTSAALQGMVLPGMIVILTPLAVGLVFRNLSGSFHIHTPGEYTPVLHGHSIDLAGAEAGAALLMVGTIVGILMAMVMNNSGGAWDSAKSFIEMGAHGGERSAAHKAAVVGDTVGDPFKSVAGPSLHVVVKLLATLMLVLAPLFV